MFGSSSMALTLEQIEELFVYPLICRRKTRTFCHHSAIHTALSHINTTILYTLNTFFSLLYCTHFQLLFTCYRRRAGFSYLISTSVSLSHTELQLYTCFRLADASHSLFFFHSCAVLRFSIQCMCILPRVGASIPCKSRWNAANLMASNFFL